MKKNLFKKLNLAGCLLLSTMSLTSCFFLYAPEGDIAVNQFEKVIDGVKSSNKTLIKEAFADSIEEKTGNFDEQVDNFITFFEGDNPQILHKSGHYITTKKSKGEKYCFDSITFDKVITDTNLYVFHVYTCVIDTKNSANVGIWNFFVVKCPLTEEDIDYDYDFSGWEDTDKFRGITLKTYEEMKENNMVLNSK